MSYSRESASCAIGFSCKVFNRSVPWLHHQQFVNCSCIESRGEIDIESIDNGEYVRKGRN